MFKYIQTIENMSEPQAELHIQVQRFPEPEPEPGVRFGPVQVQTGNLNRT
jgi:hypothetical protein